MTETVSIESLGAQGDGITGDGLYVAGALPGERVDIDRAGDRGLLKAVREPSPHRTEPLCPHYRDCGGCVFQHGDDALVAEWKSALITRALAARGIEVPVMRPVLTSPPASRRRISVSARRGKKAIQIGFHAKASDQIVPISACIVARPELVDALPALAELVPTAASRRSAVRIVLTATENGVDAAFFDAKELDGPGRALLAGAANRAGVARLSWNGEPVVTRMPPVVRFGRARVLMTPGGFLQATEEGERALTGTVREIVGGARHVADLFCGMGTFTLPLAEQAEIRAFEGDASAIAALDRGWREAEGLRHVEATRRDLAHRPLLAREFRGIEAVVIDPPRAGARAQVETLAQSDVPVIASVSCNPATFARDSRILMDGGYRLDWIQPVDQFRWAAHVELVARFSRP